MYKTKNNMTKWWSVYSGIACTHIRKNTTHHTPHSVVREDTFSCEGRYISSQTHMRNTHFSAAESLACGQDETGPSASKPSNSGTSASTAVPPADEAGPSDALLTAQEEEALFGDDDDDLDEEDLNALEATLTGRD